jgi:hypothetical protein
LIVKMVMPCLARRALEIIGPLRRRFARLNLCAHLLEASSESFNLLPLLRSGRLQLKRAVP